MKGRGWLVTAVGLGGIMGKSKQSRVKTSARSAWLLGESAGSQAG